MFRRRTAIIRVLALAAFALGALRVAPQSVRASNPPDPILSTVTASPTLVPTDAMRATTITVTLRDSNGAPVLGEALWLSWALASPNPGQGHAVITYLSGLSDSAGVVTYAVADVFAETLRFTVTDGYARVTLQQAPTVTFMPTGPYGVTLTPTPLTVNTFSQFTTHLNLVAPNTGVGAVTVTVAYNAGQIQPVSCAQNNQGSVVCNTASNPMIVTATNTSGYQGSVDLADLVFEATDRGDVPTSTASTTITPTVLTFADPTGADIGGGAPLETPAAVTIIDPASAVNSSVFVAGPTRVVADGSSTASILVQLSDPGSPALPVAAKTVTLTASGGHSQISAASGPSNGGEGVVTFTITDTTAETVTYTAADTTDSPAVTLAQQATVTFVPGAASTVTSTFTASPASPTANGTSVSTLTLTAKDAHGNLVPNTAVLLSQAHVGGGGSYSTVTPQSLQSPTNGSGVSTFTVTDTHAENVAYTVLVGVPGVSLTTDVNFVAGAATAAKSSLMAYDPLGVADGSTPSSIHVSLKDSFGNGVAGDSVTLTQSSGAHSVVATTTVTSGPGGYTAFKVTDTKSEPVTFTATDMTAGIQLSGAPMIRFTAGPVATSSSTISPATQDVQANGTRGTIIATLLDANGNPATGKTVTLTASGGASTIGPSSSVITDDNGRAIFAVSDGGIENVTYTGKDVTDNLQIGSAVVDFVAAGPMTLSGSTSDVPASTRTIAANAGGTACASTTQKLKVQTYLLSLPASCGTTSQAVTFTVAGQAAGLQTSSGATCLSFTADTTATDLQIITGGAQNMTCPPPTSPVSSLASSVALGGSTIVADGASAAAITVTLKDGSGNPVSGKTVALGQSLQSGGTSHSTLTTVSATTDSSGQARFGATDTTVENVSFTVDDVTDTIPISVPVTVSFVSAPPSGSMTITGTTSTFAYTSRTLLANVGGSACVAFNQNDTSSYSLTLPSFCGPGAVTFTVGGQASGLRTSGGATCLLFAGNTSVSGLAVNVGGAPDSSCAVPGPVSVANSTVVAGPPNISANGAQIAIIVTLKDAGGNPVSGVPVALSQALQGGGTAHSTITAVQTVTDGYGQAIFEAGDSTAENVSYTAVDSRDSLTLAPVAAISFFTPA